MEGINILAVNDPAINSYKTDSVTNITKEWEKNNSLKIHIDIINWENYKKEVDNALIFNKGNYDIVMAPSFWIANYASNKRLACFEDYINDEYDIKDIFPSIIDEISYEGKLIAVPSFTDGHIIFYRKDKIKLNKIISTDDIKDALKSINDNKNRLALKASQYEIFLDYLPFLWNESGKIFDNNEIVLDSKNAIKALNKYVELKKYCPPNIENYGNDEVKDAIRNGEAYIGVSWSGQSAAIMNENNYKDDIGFTTYEYPCNTTWTFLVNKQSKKKKESFDYLMYCTNKENDLKSGRISGSPVRMSVYQNKQELKLNPWYEVNYLMLKNAKRVPPHKAWTEISDVLYQSVYEAFTGTLKPEKALNECCNKIKKIIIK